MSIADIPQIANIDLSESNVPTREASFALIFEFALSFDGYEFWGSEDRSGQIANDRCHHTLCELRTCLFFEQRRYRHFGEYPQGEDAEYVRGLVSKIRDKVAHLKNDSISRLNSIVNLAYTRLRTKVHGGRITVDNEASLQLHFASLLHTIGELYVNNKSEVFLIELEKPAVRANGLFGKSQTCKAKIDIWIAFENLESKVQYSCAIELKYLKHSNHREPNNRYDVFSDIQNLESYGEFADIGYMIVATDHVHYVSKDIYSPDTADFDFRDGQCYSAKRELKYKTEKPYGPSISLFNSYSFSWDKNDGGFHFLKLPVDPCI
jgi:hypothetical protein